MDYLTASRIYVTEKSKQKTEFLLNPISVLTGFYLAINFGVTKNQLI